MNRALKLSTAALFGVLGTSCSPSSTSIVVTYPTEAARAATKAIGVYAFPQEANAATATCREFMAHLPKGEALGANPVDDPFPLMGTKSITNFPAGAPVVLVVGYNDTDNDRKKPILQGCSDTYGGAAGFSDVPIKLEVVIPAKASLNKLAGDHQVGPPNAELPVPLKLLVDTAFDMATQRDRYPLPAVSVHFEIMGGGGVSLNDAAAGAPLDAFSDENGLIVVKVKMPPAPGTFIITATSLDIQAACEASLPSKENKAACKAPSVRSFTVSSVDVGVMLGHGQLLPQSAINRVVGVALGDVVGDSKMDAVILGCSGTEDGCIPGRAARGPLGHTVMTVIADVTGAKVEATTPMNLGVLPGGLFVGPMIPMGHDEIALVNSRREDCQGRQTPCEGSEALVFSGDDLLGIHLESRGTLTGSNSVALVGVRRDPAGGVFGPLLTAAQGRSSLGRECSRASMCLFDRRHECPNIVNQAQCDALCANPTDRMRAGFCMETAMGSGMYTCPARKLSDLECSKACTLAGPAPSFCVDMCPANSAECGCPPNERCECTAADGCPNIGQPGTCVAQDKFIDRVTNGWADDRPPVGCNVGNEAACFENKGGCHEPSLFCVKGGEAVMPACSCGDVALRGNACTGEDGCGCKVPVQISIGDQAGVVAHDIAVGKLTAVPGNDLLAASDGGLDFLPRQADGFKWSIRKTPTSEIDFVRTLRLDRDAIEDIAWLSKTACDDFSNAAEPCPLARELVMGNIDGTPAKGCLGLYVRKSDNKVDTVTDDGCRRYQMPLSPAGVCIGDVNGDSFADIVTSDYDKASVFLYLGDGSGGVLDPPLEIPLPPGGKGGMVACGDVDGDDHADVLVVGKDGTTSLLKTRP